MSTKPIKNIYVKTIVAKHKPELFFVSEAEVDISLVTLFDIDGYTLIISEGCPKARLACYVSHISNFKYRSDLANNSVDIITMDNGTSRIVGVYRPFKLRDGQTKHSAADLFFTTLYKLSQTDLDLWVGGDFNINLEKHSFETAKLLDFVDELALHRLVKTKTWERVVTQSDGSLALRSSQIDHVFTSVKGSSVCVDDKWTSDHKLLILTTPVAFPQLERQKVSTRSWRNFNSQNLNACVSEALLLEESDTFSDLYSSDPNLLNDKINLLLSDSFDKICLSFEGS
jgi:hypothetical protein